MTNPATQTVIDAKTGNITGLNSKDKITLVGVYPNEDSTYADNLKLILNPENGSQISINFPYGGYDMQLFVGDFTGDKKSEIMVRGSFGGSGGFEIGVIYEYKNNSLVEIFNQDKFYNNNSCTAKFKENYKVSINCSSKKYLVDISSKPKDYLDYIYTSNGKLKDVYPPYVDAPSGIYPLKQVYNDYYSLLINQRVVGVTNSDTLAVIQTLGNLLDSKFSTLYKGLLFPYYSYDKKNDSKRTKLIQNNKNSNTQLNSLTLFKRNEVYYGKEFNIEKDNLDLIINSINEDRGTLYVDGYLLNLKNITITQINNFNFQLNDGKGNLFAQKTFNNIDIQNSLRPFEGKRVFLTFYSNEYNLAGSDTSSITWDYTYDIR